MADDVVLIISVFLFFCPSTFTVLSLFFRLFFASFPAHNLRKRGDRFYRAFVWTFQKAFPSNRCASHSCSQSVLFALAPIRSSADFFPNQHPTLDRHGAVGIACLRQWKDCERDGSVNRPAPFAILSSRFTSFEFFGFFVRAYVGEQSTTTKFFFKIRL